MVLIVGGHENTFGVIRELYDLGQNIHFVQFLKINAIYLSLIWKINCFSFVILIRSETQNQSADTNIITKGIEKMNALSTEVSFPDW